MVQARTVVFISHISEEAELATMLRTHITEDFLGIADVFVSSDRDSLRLGSRWLLEVDQKLSTAAVMLVLASPFSVRRPWVTFEAGAGWAKGISVIPLCHSGLALGDLTAPISLLQAAPANDADALRQCYREIANTIGCEMPRHTDFDAIASKVISFEANYGVGFQLTKLTDALREANPAVATFLASLTPGVQGCLDNVDRRVVASAQRELEQLARSGNLQYLHNANRTEVVQSAEGFSRFEGGPLFATATSELIRALKA
jgi:hypothetical protein